MPGLEELEILIDANGKVSVRADGFAGDDCLKATEALEAALGNQLLSREMRPDSVSVAIRQKTETRQQIRRG